MATNDMLDDVQPADLELGMFSDFRQIQREAAAQAAYGERRVQALCMPTGSGKSAVAEMIAQLTGWRTGILTATKGLEDQYGRTFQGLLYDIRGRSNYECPDAAKRFSDPGLTCEDGQHMNCSRIKNGCTYEEERNSARRSRTVLTNYAYWLAVNKRQPGLELLQKVGDGEQVSTNPFECLVLDEAHEAPEQLAGFLNVQLYEKEVRELVGVDAIRTESIAEWREWSKLNGQSVVTAYAALKAELVQPGHKAKVQDVKLLRRMEALVEKLAMIGGMNEADWLCEYKEGTRFGRVWEFDAVWPGKYAERFLFRGIPRIVLMSATLRPKTLGLLGIRADEADFREWPAIFDRSRCPVYFLPPKKNGKEIRVDRHATSDDLNAWVEHIDKIIDARRDRKGLICTVSYDRQQYLMQASRNKDLMIGNTSDPESGKAADVYREHVATTRPTVLVSPSFSTGWDFPYKACEYVIICKVAFPDGRSKVMKARKERDPDYPYYLAILDLVQGCGRGMRAPDDQCEVFIVDGHWSWIGNPNGKYARYAPMGFMNAVRRSGVLPAPLEKLK